jgi:ABC-type molybdate transport system substrate-binding protein
VGKWSVNGLLGSVLVLASVSAVQAAELQVIAGGGIAGPLNEIAALFERASGHKLVIRYGTAPELIKMATSGVPFDLGVVPQDVWKDAAKTKAQGAPKQIAEAVANGDADLAVFTLNVLVDPRLDIVGPFPADVQREVVYAVGIAAHSKEPEAAKAFVAYLASPPAIAVIKAKGMNPG